MTSSALGGAMSGDHVRRGGHGPREPAMRDYPLFFVGLPLFFALWATALGLPPASTLDFGPGFLYLGSQVTAAWWANGLGCQAIKCMPVARSMPRWLVLVLGFWVIWLPMTLFYHWHYALFVNLFPQITTVMPKAPFEWRMGYLLHLMRYSAPFVPLWITAVYLYQFLFGVRWFSRRDCGGSGPAAADPGTAASTVMTHGGSDDALAANGAAVTPDAGLARLLAACSLASASSIHAIKAEEHYIRVWSDEGSRMVRYRFGDAVADLSGCDGGQTHRSWWIRWACVSGRQRRGRKLTLTLANGLQVPVSLAHHSETRRQLEGRRPAPQPARPVVYNGDETSPAN